MEYFRFPSLPLPLMVPVMLGYPLYSVSSPFGHHLPTLFLNSLSSGCVSKLYGMNGVVMLASLRSVQGCEGGLVIAKVDNEYRYIILITSKWVVM